MTEMVDWARDLLMSRGALVETEEAGALRAMLSPELAGALESSEWLSLRFGSGVGPDDEGEWLERLGRLLPRDARVTGARLRHLRAVPPIDSGALLDRELVIQNGIYRLLESAFDCTIDPEHEPTRRASHTNRASGVKPPVASSTP